MNKFFPEIHTKFGFGCMRLPMNGPDVDIEQFKKMTDRFLEEGFNYFDTAHGYIDGKSETALRAALTSRYPRDAYLLTDKLTTSYFNKEEDIRPLFQTQLEACGVAYFDFYLMHAQNADIFEKYKKCRAYETAFALKEEGKIRHVGISFHDKADVLDQILTEYPQIEIVQIQFNYLDYDSSSVQSRKVYDVCVKHNKPVIVMEPVKGGSLVRLPQKAQEAIDALPKKGSNASYAIRFAAGFDQIRIVLSGMSDLSQMEDNISYMKDFQPLTKEEHDAIGKVVAVFNNQQLIPCTACKYCIEENHCPKDILIPNVFSAYNDKKAFGDWNADYYYSNVVTLRNGKASECIKCGKCEKVCPQHLPIRDYLGEAVELFEAGSR